ncbi:MAG: hypothetical protein SGPRY_014157, partial [Prymnesium sp.]
DHAILEVEAETATEELTFPPFVVVEREVTNEKTYDSYRIAKQLGELAAEEEKADALQRAVNGGQPSPPAARETMNAELLKCAIRQLERKKSIDTGSVPASKK